MIYNSLYMKYSMTSARLFGSSTAGTRDDSARVKPRRVLRHARVMRAPCPRAWGVCFSLLQGAYVWIISY
jgi:hypothetical protein